MSATPPLILDRNTPASVIAQIADAMPEEGLIINIDKPYTWTSADVVRKLKFKMQKHWHLKKIKIGHAGTLDPLATGVLVICAGKATKASENYQSQQKEYVADFCFGATTPSFDLEHDPDAQYPYRHITRESLSLALQNFIGPQEQLPPVYSAKFTEGMRAYEMVRQGMEVPELTPTPIEIYQMELLSFDLPIAALRIACSKGTYIRALARDLGVALESGAHLTRLERTRSGNFTVADALALESIEKIFEN